MSDEPSGIQPSDICPDVDDDEGCASSDSRGFDDGQDSCVCLVGGGISVGDAWVGDGVFSARGAWGVVTADTEEPE